MNTNAEQEDFEALRRLLVLKRYEQPPPGYFDRFAAQVTARIRQQERAETRRWIGLWELPWLQRARVFVGERVLPAALGVGVCGLMVLGVARSRSVPNDGVDVAAPALSGAYFTQSQPAEPPRLEPAAFQSSTSGILPDPPRPGIFSEILQPENRAGQQTWGLQL
jgi:hypothetical protein